MCAWVFGLLLCNTGCELRGSLVGLLLIVLVYLLCYLILTWCLGAGCRFVDLLGCGLDLVFGL